MYCVMLIVVNFDWMITETNELQVQTHRAALTTYDTARIVPCYYSESGKNKDSSFKSYSARWVLKFCCRMLRILSKRRNDLYWLGDIHSSSCERQCKANQYVTTTKYFCFFINATLSKRWILWPYNSWVKHLFFYINICCFNNETKARVATGLLLKSWFFSEWGFSENP